MQDFENWQMVTGGVMQRLFLLVSVILALPTVSRATSVDYASEGSIGAGTATLKGNATVGGSLTITSPLIEINSVSAMGTVTLATAMLATTSNPHVFNFTGGSITVLSSGNMLFHGAFSSGAITLSGGSAFTISDTLNNGAAITTEVDEHGDVQADTIAIPESGTLGLIATGIGLIGLADIARRNGGIYRDVRHLWHKLTIINGLNTHDSSVAMERPAPYARPSTH
jgi:hypothetical protein